MNKYILLSIVAFLALSVTGLAQLPTCPDNVSMDPGEPVILNGTAIPPTTTPVTSVEYLWQFVDIAGTPFNVINESDKALVNTADEPFFNFSAPTAEGCYKAYLTVWFNRTVDGITQLKGSCVDADCFALCVNKTVCPLCDNISCWDVAPKCTSLPCDGQACPACMCFENFSDGLTVWYNVSLGGSPKKQYDATANDGCVCIDWTTDPYVNDTYVITMDIYDEAGNKVNFDCRGNVSIVQNPEADIRREIGG